MNKKLFGALCLAIVCVGAVAYSSQYFMSNSSRDAVLMSEVEALSSCEITRGNKVIKFACSGNTGTCTASAYGYTLTCNGTKVKK